MIEFEARDVYRGWKVHSIPDAIGVELRLRSTEHRFSIPLVDLVRIYEVVEKREQRIVDFGASGAFELEGIKNDVGFVRMPPICIGLPLDELEDALEDLLGEVFEMCDETDGPKNRERQFPDIQHMLEKRDCDVDIRELYERITESSNG